MSKNVDKEMQNDAFENQFNQWLEGKTTSCEDDAVDFSTSELWRERADVADKLTHYAAITPEEKVPTWDRSQSFESDKRAWWQWQGLPAMSFACSLFAISMVLLKVEVSVQEQGFTLSFAGNNPAKVTQQVEDLLDQKLQAFASEQQVVLANYAADIKVKQQESNLQLASYLMGASRQERKEDMSEFMKYINDQRKDDQFNQQLKLERFAETVLYQSAHQVPADNKVKPANWITEE